MYLGSWDIDDYVPIPAVCHRFSTGAAYAPTALTYSIYEDATVSPGIDENVDMVVASPFDGIVGCYMVRRQLTAAAGFEAGKNYTVVIKATVDGVAAVDIHQFQIKAKVDTRAIAGTAQTAGDVVADVAATHAHAAAAEAQTVPLHSGTCVAGSSYTVVRIAETASTVNDYYNGALLVLTGGTGAGQARLITDYAHGANHEVTVDQPLLTAPDATTTYRIMPFSPILLADTGTAVTPFTSTTIKLGASAPAVTDAFKGHTVYLSGGTGIGQARLIVSYANDRVATVSPAWTTTPDATTIYLVLPIGRVYVDELSTGALAAINAEVDGALNTAIPGSPTADSINERVKALDDHVTADYGSTEKAAIDLLDDVSAGLGDIHTDVGTVMTDVAATHAHAAAAETQTAAAAIRTAVGLATASLDTQLAALPTDADVNAACDTAITDAALATAAALAVVDGIVDTLVARILGTLDTGTHKPQSGDAYAIVNSGSYGNAALKTLIDAVDDYVDTEVAAILAAVDTEVADILAKVAGLPQGFKKNTAAPNFEFFMADSSDHVTGKTGLTITATRSIDGAAFGACTASAVEVGNGVYKIDLSAADLNGNLITLRFAGAGADTTTIFLKTGT